MLLISRISILIVIVLLTGCPIYSINVVLEAATQFFLIIYFEELNAFFDAPCDNFQSAAWVFWLSINSYRTLYVWLCHSLVVFETPRWVVSLNNDGYMESTSKVVF